MKALKSLVLALILSVATLSAQDSYNYGYSIEFDEEEVEVDPIPIGKPPFWMLTSPGAMRTYALSLIARGESQVWGSTIVYGLDTNTVAYAQAKTPHEMVSSLANEGGSIVFDLADSSDSVARGAWLYDKHWNTLFYAWEFNVQPVRSNGRWTLPPSLIVPELSSEISIPVPEGVTGAKIFYRNDNQGYEWTNWNLDVWDGMIRFPVEYAGKGQLILDSPDGSIVIDLRTGFEIAPVRIVTTVELEFSNYGRASDKGLPLGQKLVVEMDAVASDNPSDAPILWVTLERARTVKFTMQVLGENDELVEAPWQAHAFNRTTGRIVSITATAVINPDGTFSLPYFERNLDEAGEWIIWFDTEHFNRKPYHPYYWGRKG